MKVVLRPPIDNADQYGWFTAEIECETYEEAIDEYMKFKETYVKKLKELKDKEPPF